MLKENEKENEGVAGNYCCSISRRRRLEDRDLMLASRFWYWSEVKRVRYDDVLQILGDREFYLDEQSVSRILHRSCDYVSGLSHRDGSLRRLKKAYPWWNWG